MDILDEFDINIKGIGKDGRMAYSAIAATLKYLILWLHQRQ
jgi:Lrp/AsnC family transcriptional regulator for asnA, asnC and gidA